MQPRKTCQMALASPHLTKAPRKSYAEQMLDLLSPKTRKEVERLAQNDNAKPRP